MPWPAPPFAFAWPDSKAKCAALSEPSAADRCNEPETETAEVLSSMLLGCLARPCTYLDVGCNLGSVAGLAAAHGATAECFETYPLWVSAVRLHGLAQRLRLAPEVYEAFEGTWTRGKLGHAPACALVPCGTCRR